MSDAQIAERARLCAEELFGGRGVGGNRLRYDDLAWSQPPAGQRSSDYLVFVTIPEEPPVRQLPHGRALSLDLLGDRCQPAAMD